MNKAKVIATLDFLPSEFTTEELIDRLLFIDKVEQGQKDVEQGRIMTLEEAKSRLDHKWSK